MMLELTKLQRSLFPLRSENDVIKFIQQHLKEARDSEGEFQPNLSLLSIVLGYVEHELTQTKIISDTSSSAESEQECKNKKIDPAKPLDFPVISLDIILPLYEKFTTVIKGAIDKSLPEHTNRSGFATREVCKKISNSIWNRLFPNYHKDKAHIQTLFSFLTNRQLDCFGLALTVVCAAQVLGYKDVHLVLSEDHAWVSHADKEMTEVTWHGRGNEDKRGSAITDDVTKKNWMYCNGSANICDRWSEVASMITSINPLIDSHTENEELSSLHNRLLRIMYNNGALDKYPMALSLLADYEASAILPSLNSLSPEKLHSKAVECVRSEYCNLHILPYCSQGSFFLSQGLGLKAITAWANASNVLSNYNYTRDDEEIYKEFREIASDLIPQALKGEFTNEESKEAFMQISRFYDGICLWEEGSPTPVLHSWWAKYFTTSMSRFSADVRMSFRCEDFSDSEDESGRKKEESNTLDMKSEKMIGLSNVICREKINTQAVGLQLTAQSQVNFEKRKSNAGDYSIEYGTKPKRKRKIRSFE